MKTLMVAALMFAIPSISLADQFVTMPNGGGCWVGSSGAAYGCSGGSSGDSAADRARVEEARARKMEARNVRDRAAQLEQCLRTADWPGMPGRAECVAMYGQR